MPGTQYVKRYTNARGVTKRNWAGTPGSGSGQSYLIATCNRPSPASLLVFISPTDSGSMRCRYQPMPDEKNLIWIGANHSGNRVRVARRVSLALLATALADRDSRIDAARV